MRRSQDELPSRCPMMADLLHLMGVRGKATDRKCWVRERKASIRKPQVRVRSTLSFPDFRSSKRRFRVVAVGSLVLDK
jgi:hypothetical protein